MPPFDASRPYKPLDFGKGLVTGSVAPDGTLLALSAYDQTHGYLTLGGSGPFPDRLRHDPGAVRAYRSGLAGWDAPSTGLQAATAWETIQTFLLGALFLTQT